MAKPLQGGIAKQVYSAMKHAKMSMPATLIKVTSGTRTPGNVSSGTNPTELSYKAAGFVADFDVAEIDNSLVFVGDRKISLYGSSIGSKQVPAPDDKVTIAGATYRIRRVQTDPANALYVCQTHGPGVIA